MSLGKRIKNLREEFNLTQEDLGKILNVSKPSISRYEANTNEPNTDTLKKLAKYFNVSLDFLMGITDIKNPYQETPEERKSKVKSLREELVDLMIKQGLISSIDDIDEHMLKIIEASIKTYAEVTNNKRKDHE